MLQSTRDHEVVPTTAHEESQHVQKGDAASDADSEDDLLDQVHSHPDSICESQEISLTGFHLLLHLELLAGLS